VVVWERDVFRPRRLRRCYPARFRSYCAITRDSCVGVPGNLSDEYLDNRAHSERAALWQARFSEKANKPFFRNPCGDRWQLQVCLRFPKRGSDLRLVPGQSPCHSERTGQGIGRLLLNDAARRLLADVAGRGLYLWVIDRTPGHASFIRGLARMRWKALLPMPDGGRPHRGTLLLADPADSCSSAAKSSQYSLTPISVKTDGFFRGLMAESRAISVAQKNQKINGIPAECSWCRTVRVVPSSQFCGLVPDLKALNRHRESDMKECLAGGCRNVFVCLQSRNSASRNRSRHHSGFRQRSFWGNDCHAKVTIRNQSRR